MTIIFPIGGKGERFRQTGIRTPKPFILLQGKTLIEHAMESYSYGNVFVFLIRKDLIGGMEELLAMNKFRDLTYRIYPVSRETKGPTETILSTDFDAGEEEVLFADCDSAIGVKEISDAINLFRVTHADGGVTYRITEDLDCSYCIMDDEKWVIETKEKNREFRSGLSQYSTTGPYYWKSFSTFKECAEDAMMDGEYHISPTYNYLIQRGGRVKAFPVSTFRHYGSPEALAQFGG